VFPFFGVLLLIFDSGSGAGWLRRVSRRLGRFLVERRRRAVACRDLRSLDEYMLRDIGLSHRAASESDGCRRDRS
jgi:uncharacterized protein YjiS (DUF1127 family)